MLPEYPCLLVLHRLQPVMIACHAPLLDPISNSSAAPRAGRRTNGKTTSTTGSTRWTRRADCSHTCSCASGSRARSVTYRYIATCRYMERVPGPLPPLCTTHLPRALVHLNGGHKLLSAPSDYITMYVCTACAGAGRILSSFVERWASTLPSCARSRLAAE